MTDQNSSPWPVTEPAIDIADLYVFPSSSQPVPARPTGARDDGLSQRKAWSAVLGRRRLPVPDPARDRPAAVRHSRSAPSSTKSPSPLPQR